VTFEDGAADGCGSADTLSDADDAVESATSIGQL
jgi:hypothetical protein